MVSALAAGLPGSANTQKPTHELVPELLAAYLRSDFGALETARPHLRRSADLRRFSEKLRQEANRAPPLVVAAFALEVAAIATEEARLTRPSSDRMNISRLILRELLEIGCDQFKRVSASAAFVRDWDLAALSYLNGPALILWGGVEFPESWNISGVAQSLHPSHARQRFPLDPKVGYWWAVSREHKIHAFLYSRGVAWSRDMPSVTALKGFDLDGIAAAYNDADGEGPLPFDARLRLGRVRSWQGKPQEALKLWRHVGTETEDPVQRYLAHVFAGRTLMDLSRAADAIVEFRSALRLRPGTQSAAVPLASLLYLTDQRQEAGEIVAALLDGSAGGGSGDPWADYLAPGYRDWPTYLGKVREGLKK
jgi:hypothetical protein